MHQGIRYEFTTKPDLLSQYYALVTKCYEDDLDVQLEETSKRHTHTKRDDESQGEHIIVACAGTYVIGGARLVISNWQAQVRLPLEAEDFLLQEVLPDVSLVNKNYCELGRLAVLLDFRGREIVRHILYYSLSLAQLHDCRYGFWIAPEIQARYYKQVLKKHGVQSAIHEAVLFPYRRVYKNIPGRIVLSSCDLTCPDFRRVLLDNPEIMGSQAKQLAVA
jgi:hypothetical protein